MSRIFKRMPAGILLCLISGISIFIACKKMNSDTEPKNENPIIKRFFTLDRDIDPVITAIANSIREQDKKRNFVTALSGKAGYPVWHKARVSVKDDSSKKMVFIPFVLENKKQTEAILVVKVSGTDTLYHLLYGAHYRKYPFDVSSVSKVWSAKDVFHAFLVFDREIFGHTKFRVTDGRLLNNNAGNESIIELGDPLKIEGASDLLASITIIVTIKVCGSCSQNMDAAAIVFCCNAVYYEAAVTYWFDEALDDWGWYSAGGVIEAGGGEPCPGCSWEDTNPCEVDENGQATSFCDPFWEPIPTLPPYNPLKYDSVWISAGLENKYPCTAAFLNDSLPNVNYLGQIAGAAVFKDSAYMHLTFDTSTISTQQGQRAGHMEVNTQPFINNEGITKFGATIHLNGWYLRNGTKEFMVSTIVHEAMHAIFTMRWGQYIRWRDYQQGIIDSNWIKTHYPSQWYYKTNQTPRLTAMHDHEIMAADYMNLHNSIVQQFWNPAASPAIRDSVLKAIAYGGLTETSVWKNLPNRGIDTCKYRAIQVISENSSTGPISIGSGCPNYYMHFSDSLKLRPSCN